MLSKIRLLLLLLPLTIFSLPSRGTGDSVSSEGPRYYDMILRVGAADPDADIAWLRESGVKVLHHRDDICLTLYPDNIDINAILAGLPSLRSEDAAHSSSRPSASMRRLRRQVDRVRSDDRIRRSPLPRNLPVMDRNRLCYDLESTLALPKVGEIFGALDGRNVVVGFSDIGFDASHINFRSSDGSGLRVRKVAAITENLGEVEIYESPDEILEWLTDNENQFHATHVAGIMAGGYDIDGLQGIASAADIVAATSQLTDVGILAGVEEIIAYAKKVDKPAVVNLSVGNYTGAHDGSSLFCQYLDKCAGDAVICIASGNEGTTNAHVSSVFDDSQKPMQLYFAGNDWIHFDIKGITDLYSADSTPFEVSIYTREYNKPLDQFTWQSPKMDFSNRNEYIITSDKEMADTPGYIYSDEFAGQFEGEIYLFGGIDPENGRFCVRILYLTHTDRKADDTRGWAHYRYGAFVYGSPGQRIDGFIDCTSSHFDTMKGISPVPSSDFCVSDLATGFNTISVGMYCGRESVLNEDKADWGAECTLNTVHSASGYGTLLDGRRFPLTVAPGLPIVSSLSGPYIRSHGEGISSFKTLPRYDENEAGNPRYSRAYAESADDNQSENYHYWGPYGGTSMATPYVAGTVALMLQMNPRLTHSDISRIIENSNDSEGHPYSENPRNSNGFFNPGAALQPMINDIATSSPVLDEEESQLRISSSREMIEIFNPENMELSLTLISSDGRIIACTPASDAVRQYLPAANLPSGVYILRIITPSAPLTCRFLR